MKKLSKALVAGAASAAMLFTGFAGMTSTAFAVDGDGTNTEVTQNTYKIDITGANQGHTYEAYQVFTGDLNVENEKKVLSTIKWGSAIKADAITDGKVTLLLGADGAEVAKTAAEWAKWLEENQGQAKAFADAISSKLGAATATTSTAVKDGEKYKYTISGLAAGYYLVKDKDNTQDNNDDVYTSFIMQVVGDAQASPKGEKPSVDKLVKDEAADKDVNSTDNDGWGKTADHEINESFQFKLVATIPTDANRADYDKYMVKFNDTMSKGVTFKEIASVTVTDGTTTATINEGAGDANYAKSEITTDATTGNQSWDLTINDLKKIANLDITKEITVTVIYNAHLNENATVNNASGTTDNKNTVNLEYSNNPNAEGTGKTPNKDVYVFSFKVDGTKVDGADATKKLAGAEFELYSDAALKNKIKMTKGTDGYYYPSDLTATTPADEKIVSNNDGAFNIKGLDAGTYYLKETKAPAGYNLLESPVTITIGAEHKVENGTPNVTLTQDSTMAFNVENNKGSQLPSTGGMGTTILYTVGALIVLAAGAGLAITMRRRNNA